MGLSKQDLKVMKGTTSLITYVYIQDDSDNDGTGKTGLVFNSAGMTAYYVRPQAAAVAITLATLAAVTSAYSSGGFIEVDATNMPGLYRFDIPNAVLASGADRAWVIIKGATDADPVIMEIELVSFNPYTADLGLSIASTVWDALLASYNSANSMGANQNLIDNLPSSSDITTAVRTALVPIAGTATAGTASTITLESGESSVDSAYNNYVCLIVKGTGAGQARLIESYVGATRVATITGTWATNPSSDSGYILVRV